MEPELNDRCVHTRWMVEVGSDMLRPVEEAGVAVEINGRRACVRFDGGYEEWLNLKDLRREG